MILKYLFLFIIYFMEVLVLQLLLYVPKYIKKKKSISKHFCASSSKNNRHRGKIHFKSFFNPFTLGKKPRTTNCDRKIYHQN